MPNKWTINNFEGGSEGSDLIGCYITKTSTGYDLFDPKGKKLVSTRDKIPPFDFPQFKYKDHDWTISVALAGNSATGSWENKHSRLQGEEGSWSAGATEGDKTHKHEGARKKSAGK